MAGGSLPLSGIRDTRPHKDKNFQIACVQNLMDYLSATRCPVPITSKTFSVIIIKDIQAIFRYLVSDYVEPESAWTKKFEDDATQILKDLRYPSLESCGKSSLASPGNSMLWPGVLAMLNWLVELNKVSRCLNDQCFIHRHPGAQQMERLQCRF